MINYRKDYYAVLEIQSSATEQEIRQAYLRLALVWHPDRHSGESPERVAYAEERFKEIGEAYALLSDHNTRSMYDDFHSSASTSSVSSTRPTGQPNYWPTGTAATGTTSGRTSSSGSSAHRNSSFDRGRSWGSASWTYTYQDTSQKSKWHSWKDGFRKVCIAFFVISSFWSTLSHLVEWASDTIRYHATSYQPSVVFWRTVDTVKMETFYEQMLKKMNFPKVEAREIHLFGSTELLKDNEALTYDIKQN